MASVLTPAFPRSFIFSEKALIDIIQNIWMGQGSQAGRPPF